MSISPTAIRVCQPRRPFLLVLLALAALAASACEVTINGQPYHCTWTPQTLVQCVPIQVQVQGMP